MSPILLSSEQPDDDLALVSRLANRIARYRACGDAAEQEGLQASLRRDGFTDDQLEQALGRALAVLGEGA